MIKRIPQRSPRHNSNSRGNLQIVYRRIDELNPDPANPRCHTKKQIRKIANSIGTFGFNVPILIDHDDNVICGHGRLAAGRELGCCEVPTVRLDHLSPAQTRFLRHRPARS
jgi:ParB-like chromosome segregation protein Spo0J